MTDKPPAHVLRSGEGRHFGLADGYDSAFKALAADTDGHLSMTEELIPSGMEVWPHRHLKAVELFYVLEGEIEFSVDGESVTADRGCCLRVDKGEAHAFANRTDAPARLLAIWSPGGFEHFYEAVAAASDAGPLDRETFFRIWREHDTEPVI
jgi:mannose-6-phosphate isomerase-like protein (cupin superfamily)